MIPIDIRLLWSKAPTLHISSPTKPLHHGFALGSHLDVTVEATPFSPMACWVDSGLRWPVQLPGFRGLLRVKGLHLAMPQAGADGRSTVRLAIPQIPGLVGTYFVMQAAVLDVTKLWLQFTNTTDCVIGK